MERQEKGRSNVRDKEAERIRLGEGPRGGRGDERTQVHAVPSDTEKRPQRKTAGENGLEELTPAGRGVRADRAGPEAIDGVDPPTSRGDERDIGGFGGEVIPGAGGAQSGLMNTHPEALLYPPARRGSTERRTDVFGRACV